MRNHSPAPFIRVAKVADELGVSMRRARVLLQQGRLLGKKMGGQWYAQHPLRLSAGSRGPKLRFNQPRRGLCMPERSEGIETALAASGETATPAAARTNAKTAQTALLQTRTAVPEPSAKPEEIDVAGKEVETVP